MFIFNLLINASACGIIGAICVNKLEGWEFLLVIVCVLTMQVNSSFM